MSNASFIFGTVEYVMLKIVATTPGFTFDPDGWTAKVTLVEVGAVFDDDAAIWTDAVLEVVGGNNYAKVLLGNDPAPGVGRYRVLVRLTQTLGGTEIPLLVGGGRVVVAEG